MLPTTFSPVLLTILLLPLVLGFPKEGIEQQIYDDLVRYTKYSSAVYHELCPRPLGNTLFAQVGFAYNLLKRGRGIECGTLVL